MIEWLESLPVWAQFQIMFWGLFLLLVALPDLNSESQ